MDNDKHLSIIEISNMNHLRSTLRFFLPYIAMLHYKNMFNKHYWKYPQLWYCWPDIMCRRRSKKYARLKERVCGFVTGHEISKTEWGYGGGKHVDLNCRWCDHYIKVPISEAPPPNKFIQSIAEEIDPKNGSGLI